ncbi:MAG: galactose mutarotase [Deltaproteobacteria bacterium]|nr:galactose mutarotase [Deltaproteobacteria bacterium]
MSNGRNDVSLVGKGNLGEIYELRNQAGMAARIAAYGGTVMSLHVPDAAGRLGDVVLGHDRIEDYQDKSPYFGCLIGRYGNRIAKARFSLDGKEYKLAANNGENSLHGGIKGFDKVVWRAKPISSALGPALQLDYVSPDGEEGFPGTLSVTAVHTLTEDNGLRIDFAATTDKKTLCNLTHHSYFNLAGKGDILGHEVLLNAKRFTPVGPSLIPTGELRPVTGTPFDFTRFIRIGERIDADDEQIRHAGGYDHNWVIDKPAGQLGLVARVCEAGSGRVMEVLATAPGAQFYSGNFLDGTITGKGGWRYTRRSALCIEPQHYPDTPNQPAFPSCVLNPGETYNQTIIYKFSV